MKAAQRYLRLAHACLRAARAAANRSTVSPALRGEARQQLRAAEDATEAVFELLTPPARARRALPPEADSYVLGRPGMVGLHPAAAAADVMLDAAVLLKAAMASVGDASAGGERLDAVLGRVVEAVEALAEKVGGAA